VHQHHHRRSLFSENAPPALDRMPQCAGRVGDGNKISSNGKHCSISKFSLKLNEIVLLNIGPTASASKQQIINIVILSYWLMMPFDGFK
jgi:hypothetical protein